jgi:hypothetical protein
MKTQKMPATPRDLCSVRRNAAGGPSLTGYRLPWQCDTPAGAIYCESRESARDTARDTRAQYAAATGGAS